MQFDHIFLHKETSAFGTACPNMLLRPKYIPSYRTLVATRKVATSSPQQTRDDVAEIISKSRNGDVAAILRTN